MLGRDKNRKSWVIIMPQRKSNLKYYARREAGRGTVEGDIGRAVKETIQV